MQIIFSVPIKSILLSLKDDILPLYKNKIKTSTSL